MDEQVEMRDLRQVAIQVTQDGGCPQEATEGQVNMAVEALRRDGWFDADMEYRQVDEIVYAFQAYYQEAI